MITDLLPERIPVSFEPTYAWLWNDAVTKDGIRRQIDEMYDCGIRSFYVLPEPRQFRPQTRRTALSPEYLSDEFFELIRYACELAARKGMCFWLYNEGGYPSGSACGQVRKNAPELARKVIDARDATVAAGEVFSPPDGCLAAFAGDLRIKGKTVFDEETTVTVYRAADDERHPILADNADRRATDDFIRRTHEKYEKTFGRRLGKEITVMFDDEACAGTWTRGLDDAFEREYGYSIYDFLPYVTGRAEPHTDAQYRAKSDYAMLCGKLLRENYFKPMREWLNGRGMLSAGHLNNDDRADAPAMMRYGNMCALLREFDVPGVDAIWGQIDFAGSDSVPFFPRLASSAARQQGHGVCLSESFAVYGSALTPELMRFVINCQAVRGISLFNFMAVSYGRHGALPLQFRPNFIGEYPGVSFMRPINEYTARLSYLLQTGEAVISTALYYPQRTVCAGGDAGKRACENYEALGRLLEQKGVAFDVIDEQFVTDAKLIDGVLVGEHAAYQNVFLPEGEFEPPAVTEKVNAAGKETDPCIERENAAILARRLVFDDGCEGYFICNTGDESIEDEIRIRSALSPCGLDLMTGGLYEIPHVRDGETLTVPLRLLRGESVMILLGGRLPELEKRCEPDGCVAVKLSACVSRRTVIDPKDGIVNTYGTGEPVPACGEWEPDFSGEVTYTAVLSGVSGRRAVLDLGEVRYFARVFVNGRNVGEAVLPPYRTELTGAQDGDELKIVVANTLAGACRRSEFFRENDIKDVGPYHAMMEKREAGTPAGGLLGPVRIYLYNGRERK